MHLTFIWINLFYINFDQIPGAEENKKGRNLGHYIMCVYTAKLYGANDRNCFFNKLDIVPEIQKLIN